MLRGTLFMGSQEQLGLISFSCLMLGCLKYSTSIWTGMQQQRGIQFKSLGANLKFSCR
ncbi:hypothetical protein COCSUDRAFT_33984 [Coccomyxa subellipsoidea C-169]|uniref:Uncharacterized protein n=1 Tax=Coccomyxa subellipsoidea (strain C-169) TaxID=574566 RepID=I0YQ12_COCSC|nr:hypothetical protein COCSUDRAFT_33984 [Coccomyxa subellipsoidea C-169]EIE20481.1 hypothetical protein COCSUDRAFT_33984 [Coccomyxa subellipsoidea C-169]|eukprot:XP_005645025.1 hypothetical protein COCSUDRAFT_33984 [Coccomyxa subellipsoidea C-169]